MTRLSQMNAHRRSFSVVPTPRPWRRDNNAKKPMMIGLLEMTGAVSGTALVPGVASDGEDGNCQGYRLDGWLCANLPASRMRTDRERMPSAQRFVDLAAPHVRIVRKELDYGVPEGMISPERAGKESIVHRRADSGRTAAIRRVPFSQGRKSATWQR